MAVVWLNGELLSEEEALVPALDRGVLWGYGLFETMRAYGGRVWAVTEHHERLRRGGQIIELAVPDLERMSSAMRDVLSANGVADGGVRITVTAGSGPPDPQSDPIGSPNALVTAWPLRDYTELYAQGAALVTIGGGGRPLAGIKTTSYAVSVAGRVIARRSGADDALFVGDDESVLEATGSNLFVARDGRLVTPPLSEAILPGITRRHVLAVAASAGFETSEENLRLADLYSSEEVAMTSSLREVYPVRSIDGRDLNRCGVAEKLRDAYHASVLSSLS